MLLSRTKSGLMRTRTGSDIWFEILVFTIMTVFLILCLYPLYFVLIASISDPQYVLTGNVILFPRGVSLEGYMRILRDSRIWTGYWNTIVYTTVGTTINVVITIMGGYALSRKEMPGRRIILFFIVFTMFFNGGMIPTFMVVRGLGLLDTIWAMVLPNALQVMNLLIARTYFEVNIPDELVDASMIDGCSTLRFFGMIVVPLSGAIIAVMILFYAITHWNSFFNALLYLTSPDRHPLQIILRNILLTNQPDAAMVDDVATIMERQRLFGLIQYGVIVVGSAPLLMMYPFVQRYFVTGVMIGSIKG